MTNRLGPGRLPRARQPAGQLRRRVGASTTLADKLGLDPLAFRLHECRRSRATRGRTASPGRASASRSALSACATTRSGRTAPRRPRRTGGCARASASAVGGWRGGLEPARPPASVDPAGTINVVVGAVDLTGTLHHLPPDRRRDARRRLATRSASSAPTAATRPTPAARRQQDHLHGRPGRPARRRGRAASRSWRWPRNCWRRPPRTWRSPATGCGCKGMPAEPPTSHAREAIGALTSGFGARHAPIAGRGIGAQTANAPRLRGPPGPRAGRSRHRRRRAARLRRHAGCRPGDQPGGGRWADPRRRRAGHRLGPATRR